MSSATSNAAPMHRTATAAPRPTRPLNTSNGTSNGNSLNGAALRQHESSRTLMFGTEEAAVLKLDLSDLPIPNIGGLAVDGLKPTLFQRLFGKK